MSVQRNTSQPVSGSQSLVDQASTNNLVRHVEAVTHQRTIPVGDGQTIVVRPRIPGWFKGLLALSLVLNLLIILVLLVVGTRGYRWYREVSAELAPLMASGLVPKGPEGASRSPADAVGSTVAAARTGVGEALGAISAIEGATLSARVPVEHQLPLSFQIPIQQNTVVTTNAPIPLNVPAVITLPGGGGYMNAQIALEIPVGTQFPMQLGLTAPVSTTVPIKFELPVNIPIQQSELAGPFARLRQLLAPVAERLGVDGP